MEEEIILSREEGGEAFKQWLSQFDAPAYIRRARSVTVALEFRRSAMRVRGGVVRSEVERLAVRQVGGKTHGRPGG